jgi:hypothetical protein
MRTPELPREDKDNTIISIMGRKNSGKSFLTREIIDEHEFPPVGSHSPDLPRVFVLDTNGEYGEDDGYEVTNTLEAGARKIAACRRRKSFKISLREKDVERLVKLVNVIYEIPRSLVVVEEAHFYVKPAFIPPEMSQLVLMGRHRALSQIYVSQRPSGLHRNFTAQSDFIVTFRQTETRDIKWLGDVAGDGAEDVRQLDRYKVRVWTMTDDDARMPLPIVARLQEKRQLDLLRGEA